MIYILVIVLFCTVLIFGASAVMGSYATASQAQATIEVARVAQVNALGNVIVILLLTLMIVAILAVIVLMFWMKQRNQATSRRMIEPGKKAQVLPTPENFSINDLIQLETLRALRGLNGPQNPALPTPAEPEPETVELFWLR